MKEVSEATPQICIVTVVDTISSTSMPVNEFVLYRYRNGYPYQQLMIVCGTKGDDKVEIPENISTYFVSSNVSILRNRLKEIKKECIEKGLSLVCHLHGQKSALLFYRASIGLRLRQHTLYTVHSTYSSRDWKYRVSSCICSLLAEYANCVSHSAYAEYAKWVKMVKGRKMLAIQNGVDYGRIEDAVRNLPIHNNIADPHKMVCVGRMIPIKNQKFLVKLMKKLPDTRLLLIGKEDEKIRELVRNEGVEEQVEMTGLLPRDEVFRRLNECGIYVSASLVEGMPVSVLEAMSVGLIPVLSDIDPHNEVANSCKLFNTLSLFENDWVQTIKTYQQLDKKERACLSAKLKDSVVHKFSLEAMHKQYNIIYKYLA